MIHHLEKFPTSAQSAHNLQKFDKNPDTLIVVDPKTRPPPMCPGKKTPWPPAPNTEKPLQRLPRKKTSIGQPKYVANA